MPQFARLLVDVAPNIPKDVHAQKLPIVLLARLVSVEPIVAVNPYLPMRVVLLPLNAPVLVQPVREEFVLFLSLRLVPNVFLPSRAHTIMANIAMEHNLTPKFFLEHARTVLL